MLDPLASPDPIVRAAAEKRLHLIAEAHVLDIVLSTYAGITIAQIMDYPALPAQEHYSIWDTNCGCKTCAEWNRRQAEFNVAKRLIPKDHNYSTCSCAICRVVGRIQLNALAAANCRDLLIEVSFHAEHHSPYGSLVMQWLDQELKSPRYTMNWCAQEMSRYTMGWWLSRIENALSPQVSGAVFKNGMHAIDMQVHFGSSLNATASFNGRFND